jgi:hypothetical protein
VVYVERLSTHRETFELPPPNSRPDTFPNQVSFEFRDAADERDEQPSHRSVRRDVLAATDELNPETVQLVHDAEKMFSAAGDAVEGCDDKNIKRTLSAIVQHRIQTRTTSLGAADAYIRILGDDLITTLSRKLPEVV